MEKQLIKEENNLLFSKSEKISLLMGLIFTVLCVFAANANMSLAASFFTLLFAVFGASRKGIEKLYLVVLAIPNTRAMEALGISGAICVCAISIIIYLIRNHKIEKSIFAYCVIYILYSLQFIVRFMDLSIGLIMPIKSVIVILFFWIYSRDKKLNEDPITLILKMNLFFFAGIMGACLASVVVNRGMRRFAIVNNDPNMLSIEIAFVLSVFCICYFRYKVLKTPAFVILAVLLATLSALCGSRMGLLLLAGVVVTSILCNLNQVNKTMFFLFVIVIVVVIFLSSNIGQNAIDVLISRNNALVSKNDISNGRMDIWNEYLDIFNSNSSLWFFGMGSYSYYGLENVAHNFLLEDIASYGIIGTIILYFAYLKVFRFAHNTFKENTGYTRKTIYSFVPFVVPIVGGITLHGLTNIPNTLMMFMGAIIIAFNGRQMEY